MEKLRAFFGSVGLWQSADKIQTVLLMFLRFYWREKKSNLIQLLDFCQMIFWGVVANKQSVRSTLYVSWKQLIKSTLQQWFRVCGFDGWVACAGCTLHLVLGLWVGPVPQHSWSGQIIFLTVMAVLVFALSLRPILLHLYSQPYK